LISGTSTSYGVVHQEPAGDESARHAERIGLVGFTVVPSGISEGELDALRCRLDAVVERQVAEFGGSDRMAAIGDALTARCPLAYDDAFLDVARHPLVLAIVGRLLGEFVVLMQQNGIVNPPGESHQQRAYHRDLPYQHFVSTRPLGISALFCLDPFRRETGATIVVPASHRVEAFPSDAVAEALGTAVEADAGSFIVFDAMLFHQAGLNRSAQPRRGVNHVYTVPIIAQQISLPSALQGRHAEDPQLARLLGYESGPAASVLDWRQRRLSRRVV
jgi:ectoine hydroxylase-related dioxygenase (phytanoyl-CoA dioxygenase family)